MTFKDQLDTDQDIFFNSDEFAVISDYLQDGESEPVQVRAIWEFAPEAGSGKGVTVDSQFTAGSSDYAEVSIPAADMSFQPGYRDRLTYPGDETDWYVQQHKYDHGLWIVAVNKEQRGDW